MATISRSFRIDPKLFGEIEALAKAANISVNAALVNLVQKGLERIDETPSPVEDGSEL